MAAKSVQPATLTCRRPPGSRPSHGDRPRNRSWLRRVRNRISPIQMNRGSAVSVQVELAVQIVVTMAGPAGREVKIRSEEHTSELQSLMRISYYVVCLKNTKKYISA